MEKDRGNRDVHTGQETEMELDRAYTEKGKLNHRKRGPGLEPAGKKEERET